MIECTECGARYEPMTDACVCPSCGIENYPEDQPFVFEQCQVCGINLKPDDTTMGMCNRCSDETRPA